MTIISNITKFFHTFYYNAIMWNEYGEPLKPIPEWSLFVNNNTSNIKKIVKPSASPSVFKARKNWSVAAKASKSLIGVTQQLKYAAQKRTRKPESWRDFKQVSVSGIDAAMDRRSPLLRRIIWTLVLIICTALMTYQCYDRVARYLDEPVNVNVRITHNDTLEFPSVTVCNRNAFNLTAALEKLIQYQLLPSFATVKDVNISLLVGLNGMSASEVWQMTKQSQSIFIAECWFGRGIKCEDAGTWTQVSTITGVCYSYRLHDNQVKNVGTFHNLYLRLKETTPALKKDSVGVRLVLHEPDDSPVLMIRTHGMTAELGWNRDIKLELRKFESLSTTKDPCNTDPMYSEAKCQFDCFQKAIYQVSKCKMPYMSEEMHLSNVTECKTANDHEEAMNAIQNLFYMGEWNVQDCPCEHECFETTYQAYPENIHYRPNETLIRIFYEALVYEQISEDFAYPMISLLCDIGGTLGLLLGASVLTVFELIEVAWSHIIRTFCRLKERDTTTEIQKINIRSAGNKKKFKNNTKLFITTQHRFK